MSMYIYICQYVSEVESSSQAAKAETWQLASQAKLRGRISGKSEHSAVFLTHMLRQPHCSQLGSLSQAAKRNL